MQAKEFDKGSTGGSRLERKVVVAPNMKVNQVEAKDFLEVQRSSFDILKTLQWTGWP